MKIYIGCPIVGLPDDEWVVLFNHIEKLKVALTERGHTILNFRSDTNRRAKKGTVFRWDRQQCLDCDAMIAIGIKPSTGMGMEVCMCLLRTHRDNRPNPAFVLGTAPRGTKVTWMLTECNLPGFTFRWFENWDNIPDIFERAYTKHLKQKQQQRFLRQTIRATNSRPKDVTLNWAEEVSTTSRP